MSTKTDTYTVCFVIVSHYQVRHGEQGRVHDTSWPGEEDHAPLWPSHCHEYHANWVNQLTTDINRFGSNGMIRIMYILDYFWAKGNDLVTWTSWRVSRWQKSRRNMTMNTMPFPNNQIGPLRHKVAFFLSLELPKIWKIRCTFWWWDCHVNKKYLPMGLPWILLPPQNLWSRGSNKPVTSNKRG